MPIYVYTATTKDGEEQEGTYEAESQDALAAILRKQGLLLTSAEVAGAAREGDIMHRFNRWFARMRGVSEVELLLFTRHLGVMIRAGLPLNRALSTLARQTKNIQFRSVLDRVEQDVRRGESFSTSLGRHPDVFGQFYVSMVEVGEAGGTMESVLSILEHHIERTHEIKSRVLGAMIYPAVIIGVMLLIGVIMMIMVVPRLTEVFEDLDVDLPIATQFVIGISNALIRYSYLVIAGLIGLGFLARRMLKQPSVRSWVHAMMLRIPIFGTLIAKVNVSRFARNFSSLLNSGVPILEALHISADTMGNVHFQQSLRGAYDAVQQGGSLHEVLGQWPDLYPLIVIQMIEVGEETGQLSTILEQLAEFYEEEVARSTENMTSIIEPVLMVVIGGVVGFFAIAMIQPMYSMLNSL